MYHLSAIFWIAAFVVPGGEPYFRLGCAIVAVGFIVSGAIIDAARKKG